MCAISQFQCHLTEAIAVECEVFEVNSLWSLSTRVPWEWVHRSQTSVDQDIAVIPRGGEGGHPSIISSWPQWCVHWGVIVSRYHYLVTPSSGMKYSTIRSLQATNSRPWNMIFARPIQYFVSMHMNLYKIKMQFPGTDISVDNWFKTFCTPKRARVMTLLSVCPEEQVRLHLYAHWMVDLSCPNCSHWQKVYYVSTNDKT